MQPLWYRNAVIYAIDPAMFRDTDGDGWGALRGITNRLEHLRGLGMTCIWLLPFYSSPFKDGGSDVTDHLSVDPRLGTLPDVVELLEEAEEAGIRVILDLVVQHTSDQHPWFQAARSDPASLDLPHRRRRRLDMGRAGRVVLPAHVLLPRARLRPRQPRRARSDPTHHGLLAPFGRLRLPHRRPPVRGPLRRGRRGVRGRHRTAGGATGVRGASPPRAMLVGEVDADRGVRRLLPRRRGRFTPALGSGQALNEHVTGAPWPRKPERNARLGECALVIRRLLVGATVDHEGRVMVRAARLYTRPVHPPPLFAAALSTRTAHDVAAWAVGLITVNAPEDRLRAIIDAFREGGGEGKPFHLQVHLSWILKSVALEPRRSGNGVSSPCLRN
jgi:hypothetical protein